MSNASELRKRLSEAQALWPEPAEFNTIEGCIKGHVRPSAQLDTDVVQRFADWLRCVQATWPGLVAALEAAEKEIRGLRAAAEKEPRCMGCGCAADLYFGPDPYAAELNDDDTPVWLCGQCSSERANDI